MPYEPTPEQRRLLGHELNRHARVLAGPGTGKSATLVALLDHLLACAPAPRIKLLTFTRAATSELAKKVSDHPAAAAERPSTVHSFSISTLLRNQGVGGFPQPLRISDTWEDKNIVQPTLARRINVGARYLSDLIREMASNWESLVPQENPRVDAEHRARFNGGWGEHRQIYGYTLLAELPYALRQALSNHPDLEGVEYDVLIVDEYQDLNACNLEVLRLISARGCVIIGAGDDDQSIYSFRRAAPEGIRRFAEDYPGSADYVLSITQRCGSRIIDWATYVIQGDPDRPNRPRLRSVEGSPAGETALLAFDNQDREAEGVAELVRQLNNINGVSPEEILVLLRGDHNGLFSASFRQNLDRLGIRYSDPEAVERMLAEPNNRRFVETFRLLINRTDSLAWAGLLFLTNGIGNSFFDYIYDRARIARVQFGEALLTAHRQQFPGAPTSNKKANSLVASVTEWIDAHPLPEDQPAPGWGRWMINSAGGDIVPAASAELRDLLLALDDLAEPDSEFNRYLSQITPLGRDRALAQSQGVRIMTMGASKGLTVRATIIVGLEDGIIPRPNCDVGEERRLLYVGMTRAREFLFGTWARRRVGPTARAGVARPQLRRRPCPFLDGGPVASQDGTTYLRARAR